MSKPGLPSRRIDALFQQALALHQNGALAEAEQSYRDVLAKQPGHFDAMQLLGTLALQSGRVEEGVGLLERAMKIDARHPAIHSNLAFALNALGRHEAALGHADQALSLAPDFADAYNNRGNALAGLERPADALASFERVLALAPQIAEAWNNRACALRDLGDATQAVESCDRAIALRPTYADAWSNRANALSDLNRPAEAKASYEKAIEANPGFADAWSNLGLTLVDLGDHQAALDCYARALTIAHEHASAHWNEALCLLETGQLERGWRAYEWRWQRASLRHARRVFTQPLWLGETSIAGRTLLLHAEQGLGDTLQFCRYAARVAQLGAKVVLEVPGPLMRLCAGLDGVTTLVEQGQALPDFDCHCPLLSLPLALGTTLDTIPADVPYLFADPQRSAVWRERIAAAMHERHADGDLRVGLVWAGGHRPHVPELRKNDARRSMSLEQLHALFDVDGVQYFSLQIGPAAAQLDALRLRNTRDHDVHDADIHDANVRDGDIRDARTGNAGKQETTPHDRGIASRGPRIIDMTEAITDFADTADLIDNLDLVISVDTSTAHLAGAMGKPVWIFNRFDTCWRWLLDRTDSPWYPSARLFRQPSLGQWDIVVDDVCHALETEVARRRARASVV